MENQTPTPSDRQSLVERLLPTLVRIQAHVDEDLPLPVLAQDAGLSPTHFHRLFRQLTGETPKQYCQRLRLERSALRLLLSRRSIFDVALDCGFNRHETFSRAFRKHFGLAPNAYRRSRPPEHQQKGDAPLAIDTLHTGCEISATRVDELEDFPVAFIRHVGPYEKVDPDAWNRLTQWAELQKWAGPPLLLGIAQDAPGITPADRLRFDSAIRAPGFFEPDGDIGFQIVSGGLYGITTHVGPWVTLEQAYRTAFERLAKLRRYRIVGLPGIEIYHATRISADYELNQTDLFIPLAKR